MGATLSGQLLKRLFLGNSKNDCDVRGISASAKELKGRKRPFHWRRAAISRRRSLASRYSRTAASISISAEN